MSNNKEWDVGLQQYVITCDKCKDTWIEDEMQWFLVDDKIFCTECYLKLRGLSSLEELEEKEYDEMYSKLYNEMYNEKFNNKENKNGN